MCLHSPNETFIVLMNSFQYAVVLLFEGWEKKAAEMLFHWLYYKELH